MTEQVSLKVVAEKAGVSAATVSRVVNGHRSIAENTRQRVQAVIDEMGYAPDPKLGRFFKTMNGGIKGVAFAVYQDMHRRISMGNDPFYARMSMAVQMELSKHAHYMLLVNEETDCTADGNLTCVEQGLCTGVIGELRNESLVARLSEHVPVVLLNVELDIPLVDVVIPHVAKVARKQLQYLSELGHRAIACFRPRSNQENASSMSWQDKRFWQSYRNFCQDHALAMPSEYLEPIDFGYDEHESAAAKFVDRVFARPEIAPTAILTYDIYAGTLIRQLSARGLEVPRDVSIIGYDDWTFNHPCPLALTTFRHDFETMAKQAVGLLLDRGKEPHRSSVFVEVDGELITRDSTAAPPAPIRSS